MADHDHAELVRGLRSWRARSGYQPRVLEAADAIERLQSEAAAMREERNAAVDDLCRWRSAFQSLILGGSEFISPESVIAWARRLKDDVVATNKEYAKLRKAPPPTLAQGEW